MAWGHGDTAFSTTMMCWTFVTLFRQLVREGLPMKEVTKWCVEDYPDPMNDVAVVLALAALQMEQKQLQPEFKRRALQMIEKRKRTLRLGTIRKKGSKRLKPSGRKLLRD